MKCQLLFSGLMSYLEQYKPNVTDRQRCCPLFAKYSNIKYFSEKIRLDILCESHEMPSLIFSEK